jgi:hypothetical protein
MLQSEESQAKPFSKFLGEEKMKKKKEKQLSEKRVGIPGRS